MHHAAERDEEIRRDGDLGLNTQMRTDAHKHSEVRSTAMNFMADLDEPRVHETCEIASLARIGHLNLRVADLDRATDFYCNVLGLTISCYGPAIGLPIVFLAFGDYHHHVALNWGSLHQTS
jgi:catechol-2,3-dioxygenase